MYQHDTLNTFTICPVKNKALNSYVALKNKKKCMADRMRGKK